MSFKHQCYAITRIELLSFCLYDTTNKKWRILC